jgi:hypothetical protein
MIAAPMLMSVFTSAPWTPLTGDSVDGVRLSVYVSEDELFADLLTYDPASGTSPSVTVCRKYVRKMFDAYLAARAAAGLPPVTSPPV